MTNKQETNLFVSYPRSGSHWLKARMRLVIQRANQNGKHHPEPAAYFTWTHYGYAPHPSLQKAIRKVVPPAGANIVVLMRDAGQVLASYFNLLLYKYVPIEKEDRLLHIEKDPLKFIKGPAGVPFFCSFMNEVDDLLKMATKNRWTVKIIYYEDMYKPEFIDRIPYILDIKFNVSGQDRSSIYEATRGLVNPSLFQRGQELTQAEQEHKHRDTFDESALKYVNDYLVKNCKFAHYTDRYLTGGINHE